MPWEGGDRKPRQAGEQGPWRRQAAGLLAGVGGAPILGLPFLFLSEGVWQGREAVGQGAGRGSEAGPVESGERVAGLVRAPGLVVPEVTCCQEGWVRSDGPALWSHAWHVLCFAAAQQKLILFSPWRPFSC